VPERPPARGREREERVLALRHRLTADGQVEASLELGRFIGAKTPHGVEWNQTARVQRATAQVRLSVVDPDERGRERGSARTAEVDLGRGARARSGAVARLLCAGHAGQHSEQNEWFCHGHK
jgi:hypothetical protein